MTQEQFTNGNRDGMYNIFDVVYAYLVSKYSIGIHSVDEKPWGGPGSVNKEITFLSDGMVILRVVTSGDPANPMTGFMIRTFDGKQNNMPEIHRATGIRDIMFKAK